MTMRHTGGCLCGAVRYAVDGPMRDALACHCTTCRKQSGHFIAATAAARADLTIEGADRLTWFSATPGFRRGFCSICGSHLFWDRDGSPDMSIFAGSLDGPTGIRVSAHIFVAEKGDYYEIGDGAPQHATWPEE